MENDSNAGSVALFCHRLSVRITRFTPHNRKVSNHPADLSGAVVKFTPYYSDHTVTARKRTGSKDKGNW